MTRATFPRLPDSLAKRVDGWLAQGFAVEVRPDGTVRVEPLQPVAGDPFDLVDMRR